VSQTLLRQIQEAATKQASDLPSLLRMCMLLAYRLGNDELNKWVESELDGYKDDDPLPNYRKLSSVLPRIETYDLKRKKVEYQAPMSMDIEELSLNEAHRIVRMRNAIAEISALAAGADRRFDTFGRHRFAGIMDAVQNRVLRMSLELEKADATLGEGSPSDIPISTKHVINQIIHQTINIVGDHAIVSAPSTQTQTHVVAGDIDSLRAALQQLGLSPQEVEETALAVKDEKTPQGAIAKLRGLWDKLTGNKVVGKAAETGAVELVKHAIKDYFGP
jgi:hypothetical protein